MISFLTGRAADAMQRRYDYDASYLKEVAAVSSGGALRLGLLLPLLSGYRSGVPIDLWAGAAVASTREGDCGPCLQLTVDMAIDEGADPTTLQAALQGDTERAGDTGLGYRFAMAAISDAEELDELREQIRSRFGEQAVIALTISAATGRAWPVVKRGLGYGKLCQHVNIAGQVIALAGRSESAIA